jgi:hypothetical protein
MHVNANFSAADAAAACRFHLHPALAEGLQVLYLGANQLTSSLPAIPESLFFLDAPNNQMSGGWVCRREGRAADGRWHDHAGGSGRRGQVVQPSVTLQSMFTSAS